MRESILKVLCVRILSPHAQIVSHPLAGVAPVHALLLQRSVRDSLQLDLRALTHWDTKKNHLGSPSMEKEKMKKREKRKKKKKRKKDKWENKKYMRKRKTQEKEEREKRRRGRGKRRRKRGRGGGKRRKLTLNKLCTINSHTKWLNKSNGHTVLISSSTQIYVPPLNANNIVLDKQ